MALPSAIQATMATLPSVIQATLPWNGYEPVRRIVLKNGFASVYTSNHNRCVYHACSLVPADGCFY